MSIHGRRTILDFKIIICITKFEITATNRLRTLNPWIWINLVIQHRSNKPLRAYYLSSTSRNQNPFWTTLLGFLTSCRTKPCLQAERQSTLAAIFTRWRCSGSDGRWKSCKTWHYGFDNSHPASCMVIHGRNIRMKHTLLIHLLLCHLSTPLYHSSISCHHYEPGLTAIYFKKKNRKGRKKPMVINILH